MALIGYVAVVLVAMGGAAVVGWAYTEWNRRQYRSIGRAIEEATGGGGGHYGGYYSGQGWQQSRPSAGKGGLEKRLQEMGDDWERGFRDLGRQLKAGWEKAVGAVKGALSRGWKEARERLPEKPPRLFLRSPWVGRSLGIGGGMMLAAGIGLGVTSMLSGGDAAVGEASRDGVEALSQGRLEALGRAWFTYDGDLGSWLSGLEPFLVPGAAGPLGECARSSTGFPLVWRLAGTRIVEGPWVEVQGRLADLDYGISGRGGAVGHPGVRERYGVELGPDDIGVRIAAVVARELPPEKAALPGTDIITRPQKVTAQLFVLKDGRAVPDETECGRGVVFVG
ncbi:MAG: hypothetical protein RMK67_02845 [Chloroflexota bacterium]|nr:hypothetical protein [Chloroflexota bacterium]